MDPLLRGVCEQYIDMKLEEKEIEKVRQLVDTLDLPVASKNDVSLGIFIGAIYSQLNIHHLKMYNRSPKKEDVEDYYSILRRRSEEIKSKFSVATAPKEASILEANKGTVTLQNESLEDYPLVLQKKTEEIKAEIGKQNAAQVTSDRDVAEDVENNPQGEFKFSFDMSTRKKPVRKIFGISTKRKEAVAPTAK